MKSTVLLLLLFFHFMDRSISQVPAPPLEFLCELKVNLKPPLVVGETPHGVRRIIPITGGTVDGRIKGAILEGGADWQVLRNDAVAELDAHYQLKTEDGVIIYIHNQGLRVATPEVAARIAKGEIVAPSEYYFRSVMKLEAPKGRYGWINNAIFICKGIRNPDQVVIQVWEVK